MDTSAALDRLTAPLSDQAYIALLKGQIRELRSLEQEDGTMRDLIQRNKALKNEIGRLKQANCSRPRGNHGFKCTGAASTFPIGAEVGCRQNSDKRESKEFCSAPGQI